METDRKWDLLGASDHLVREVLNVSSEFRPAECTRTDREGRSYEWHEKSYFQVSGRIDIWISVRPIDNVYSFARHTTSTHYRSRSDFSFGSFYILSAKITNCLRHFAMPQRRQYLRSDKRAPNDRKRRDWAIAVSLVGPKSFFFSSSLISCSFEVVNYSMETSEHRCVDDKPRIPTQIQSNWQPSVRAKQQN